MGATKELAEFILNNNYRDFDSSIVKHTKSLCLSGMGMALAGVRMPVGQAVLNYVKECCAPAETGVVGAGFYTSAEYAALANGSFAHATEYEDVGFPEVIYLCGVFPAAFALAERLGLSGKDVIQLIILGYEVQSSLSMNCLAASKRGFQIASTFGCIGAAAMASKALGLDLHKTMMALSLAASQACGLQRQTGSGAHVYEAGICGRNGISAAMLAKWGVTGLPDVLEAPGGFCDAIAGTTEPNLELGVWRIMNAGYKRYPCCFLLQNTIFGVLELIGENNITANDVEGIEVDISPALARAVRFQHPTNEEEARFSLPHSIAACFLDQKVGLASYTSGKAMDPKFYAFREKVKLIVHPEWEKPGLSGADVPVTIKLRDGRELNKVCPSTDNPTFLSDQENMERYIERACTVLSRDQGERSAKILMALDEVKEISELMKIVTFPEKQ